MAEELIMVSQASGTAGDNHSRATDVIAKGQIVVIQSLASNLAGNASGTSMQIMHYNFSTGQWTLVSSTASGTEGDADSGHPDITADNRYVVFHSSATNLGGTGANQQIFRKDLATGEIILVSKTSADVEADNTCRRPVISEDGNKVVFDSSATNLGGTGTNRQIFRKDLQTGEVAIVSLSPRDVEADDNTGHPSISTSGRYITFHSSATTLDTGADGSNSQVFRKDMDTGAIVLVSSKADGTAGDGKSRYATVNVDGRYVSFYSLAINLVTPVPTAFNHVYRKDLLTGAVDLVSSNKAGEAGDADSSSYYSQNPISADGRYIAFVTKASNHLPAATGVHGQVFRKDMVSGELALISANAFGIEGDNWSWRPSMTPDGCFIIFYSIATNLVSTPATGGFDQVYRRDMDYFPWPMFMPPTTGMGKK